MGGPGSVAPQPDNGRTSLSALEREFLPPLLEIQETPPARLANGALWTVVLLLASALVWAVLGRTEVVATAPGRFIPDGRVKVVQTPETAVVRAIHVREGQSVREGDLLLELDPSLTEADVAALGGRLAHSEAQRRRLLAELEGRPFTDPSPEAPVQRRLQQARLEAHEARLAEARAALDEKTQAVAAAEATLVKLRTSRDLTAARFDKTRTLHESGFVSQAEMLKQRQELASLEGEVVAQEFTLDQYRAARTAAARRLETLERERRAQLMAELDAQRSEGTALQGEFDKSRTLHRLKWLHAPVSGVVQTVGVTSAGAVASPAQPLVVIVPEGTPLLVEARLRNEDAGFVKPGQSVELKIDTFTFTRYGTVPGEVVWVSPDAEPDPAAPQAPPSFRAHIRPQRTEMSVGAETKALKVGMSVQADVVLESRRVIEFFLSPLAKGWQEAVRLR